MEISSTGKIYDLKEEGVFPLYSIWIVDETKDDGTFDVNVWDEHENERVEGLEEARFATLEKAGNALIRIVQDNPKITFVRLPNVEN